jgi:DNA ligase-associated metallophosphoesterase
MLLLELHGVSLEADPAGALWWPEQRLLAVADLHLEKASSLARRGHLLPPYDSRATLARLSALVQRHQPTRLLCLGDSFHDVGGPERLAAEDRASIAALAAQTELLWVEGNHDPGTLPQGLGRLADEVRLGPLLFRHQAARGFGGGEVSGHYHPKASVFGGLRRFTGRCFVTDGRRMILPAFGQLTGGLNVLDRAYRPLFPDGFEVVLLGQRRAVRFPAGALV